MGCLRIEHTEEKEDTFLQVWVNPDRLKQHKEWNTGNGGTTSPDGMGNSNKGGGRPYLASLGIPDYDEPSYTIDDVINEGLGRSPTIRDLYNRAKNNGYAFKLTNGHSHNSNNTDPKEVLINGNHKDIDQAVLDLAYELTNASNGKKYDRLSNRAIERTISRKNFIKGAIKLEAKARLNLAKAMGEIGRQDLGPANLGEGLSQYNDYLNGNLSEKNLLDAIEGEMHDKGVVQGTSQLVRDFYGGYYDKVGQ